MKETDQLFLVGFLHCVVSLLHELLLHARRCYKTEPCCTYSRGYTFPILGTKCWHCKSLLYNIRQLYALFSYIWGIELVRLFQTVIHPNIAENLAKQLS